MRKLMHTSGRHRCEFASDQKHRGLTCCIQISFTGREGLPSASVWIATCKTKSRGAKLSAGNGPAPIPLDQSGRPLEKISKL